MPNFAALEIGFDFVFRPPDGAHLLLGKQRELVVDMLRTGLRPVTVSQQCFCVNWRREFNNRVVGIARNSFSFSVNKWAGIDGPNCTHQRGSAITRKVRLTSAQPKHVAPSHVKAAVLLLDVGGDILEQFDACARPSVLRIRQLTQTHSQR